VNAATIWKGAVWLALDDNTQREVRLAQQKIVAPKPALAPAAPRGDAGQGRASDFELLDFGL